MEYLFSTIGDCPGHQICGLDCLASGVYRKTRPADRLSTPNGLFRPTNQRL